MAVNIPQLQFYSSQPVKSTAEILSESVDRGVARGQQMLALQRQREADKLAQERSDRAQELADQKLLLSMQQGLNLPPQPGDSLDIGAFKLELGEGLVNKQAELFQAYKDGDITGADFNKGSIYLTGQAKQLNAAVNVFAAKLGQGAQVFQNNNKSLANNPENEEFYANYIADKSKLSYEITDGEVVFVTTDENGKKYKAAISRLEDLPDLLEKPSSTREEQVAADMGTYYKTKSSNTGERMKNGEYQVNYFSPYEDTTINKDGKGNYTITSDKKLDSGFIVDAGNNFNTYFDSLGNGDVGMGLKQYILDSATDTNDQKRLMALASNLTDERGNKIKVNIPAETGRESVSSFVNEIVNNPEALASYKNQLKNDYINSSALTLSFMNKKAYEAFDLDRMTNAQKSVKAQNDLNTAIGANNPSKPTKGSKIENQMSFLIDTMNSNEFQTLTKGLINFTGSYDTKGEGKKEDFSNALTGGLSGDIQKDKDIFNLFGIDLKGTITDEKGDVIQYEPVGGGKIRFDVNKGFGETLVDILRYNGHSQQNAQKAVKNKFKLVDKDIRPNKWINSIPAETYKDINL